MSYSIFCLLATEVSPTASLLIINNRKSYYAVFNQGSVAQRQDFTNDRRNNTQEILIPHPNSSESREHDRRVYSLPGIWCLLSRPALTMDQIVSTQEGGLITCSRNRVSKDPLPRSFDQLRGANWQSKLVTVTDWAAVLRTQKQQNSDRKTSYSQVKWHSEYTYYTKSNDINSIVRLQTGESLHMKYKWVLIQNQQNKVKRKPIMKI